MNRTSYFLLFLVTLSLSCGKKVDLLVYNANVYTVNENFDKATAFVVDQGKFIAVGGGELQSEYDPVNTVDARGLSIFPGFIDAHGHLLGLGVNHKADLRGATSMDQIIEILKKHHRSHPQKVLQGSGWDQNLWEDKSLPNHQQLSQAFPDLPVLLDRIDGHATLANQKAMEWAAIDPKATIDGGQMVLDKGQPTGLFIDTAAQWVHNILPPMTRQDKINALLRAQEICFENGITTVDQAGISKKDIYLIDSLQRQGVMKLKVYAMIHNHPKDLQHFLDKGGLKTALLHVKSVKAYADGALGSRGAALKQVYSDQANTKGLLRMDKDSLHRLAALLVEKGFQLNTHAIGDAANATVLEVYNQVLAAEDDPRWRIEHAQVVAPEDFSLFNPKIIPSVQPTHATSDSPWAEDRLGQDRISGAYAYKDLLDWSGTLALGTDFPVASPNPFHTFYTAVTRKAVQDSKQAKPFQEKNALTRYEALLGMTRWAAHANFEEKEKGSIEVGKSADFIILDHDIMEAKLDIVPKTKIVATIINGKIVFSNRF